MYVCRQVQLDAADSSEGSFRTSSSGCDVVDCQSSSSVVERGLTNYQHLTPTDVTTEASHGCHGNVDDRCGDWSSQRWRHWQQMTIMSCRETNELQTLV